MPQTIFSDVLTHANQPPDNQPPPEPPPYDRNAIYDEAGPFNPIFVDEAVRTLIRTLPLKRAEPKYWSNRRMHSALTALASLHPRNEIEIMLGVQALCAYHAAAACWHIGMNRSSAKGDGIRHFAVASNAARTFDAMLKAVERRQAKALAVPVGRPDPQIWPSESAAEIMQKFEDRCRRDRSRPEGEAPEGETTGGKTPEGNTPEDNTPEGATPGGKTPAPEAAETEHPETEHAGEPEHTRQAELTDDTDPEVIWPAEALEIAEQMFEQQRIEEENEGLDIANTEGILPGGGMILPEEPTPQQEAYLARRLALMYKREIEENLKKGITKYPKIRGIRPGDLIP
jgi:hypothetical protein